MPLTSEPGSRGPGRGTGTAFGSLGLEGFLIRPRRSRFVAGLAIAVAGPGLVTLLSLTATSTTTVPGLLYLLTVVAAAAVGQVWPGLLGAALSFVGLDY